MIETLPLYSEHPLCPGCGAHRGRSEKFQVRYCHGVGRPGRDGEPMKDDECQYGGEPHLHWQCVFCQYENAMNVACEVLPLTAGEIRDLRALLTEVRKS